MTDRDYDIELYAVYTNTDLTEGKGAQYPFAWSTSETAAIRLSKRKGVMGADAEVRQVCGIRIGKTTFAPVHLEVPTTHDLSVDQLRHDRNEAIEKAKSAGLSPEEIKLIATRID